MDDLELGLSLDEEEMEGFKAFLRVVGATHVYADNMEWVQLVLGGSGLAGPGVGKWRSCSAHLDAHTAAGRVMKSMLGALCAVL